MLQISTQTTTLRQTNGGFAYEICLKTQNLKTDHIKNRTLRSHTHQQSSKSVYLTFTRHLCSWRMEIRKDKRGTSGLDVNNSFYWKERSHSPTL